MDTTSPEWKLEEARFRLAYINQHRELMLGAFVVLAAVARGLGAPVPAPVLGLLAVWLAASLLFVQAAKRSLRQSDLQRIELGYFLLELALLTGLAHYLGGADWLAVMLYGLTVLYANVVLPPRKGLLITLLAMASFTLLAGLEYFRLLPHYGLAGMEARYQHPGYVVATVLVGAIAGNGLIGLTSFQFARMLTAKAEALHSANSDLKAAGQELRLHRNHLEELVRQRTADLIQASEELRGANQELRRLNEVKSNFLANVSHELRTPLTSIRSFSEILLTYPEEEQSTRTEFLEIIVNETERLTRLINDVLDLAKIEAGSMALRFQAVRLDEVVEQSLDLFQLQAEQQGIDLRNAMDARLPPIQADPDRLAQVFANLLSNALKFTTAGEIEIGSRQRGEELLVYVRDTGPGLPAEARERVFEKFHQHGDVLTGKPTGTGLGLAISREIMQQHGGRIWVESGPDQGCTFFCAFKLADKDEPNARDAAEVASRQGS